MSRRDCDRRLKVAKFSAEGQLSHCQVRYLGSRMTPLFMADHCAPKQTASEQRTIPRSIAQIHCDDGAVKPSVRAIAAMVTHAPRVLFRS